MCADARFYRHSVAAALALLLAACMRLDPALLEGNWRLEEIVPADSNDRGAALVLGIASSIARGTTIAFRSGRLSVPLVGSDTLRFDYRVRSDSLVLLSGATTIERFRIARLDHDELRLQQRSVQFVFRRN
jgi:hypothetical protein